MWSSLGHARDVRLIGLVVGLPTLALLILHLLSEAILGLRPPSPGPVPAVEGPSETPSEEERMNALPWGASLGLFAWLITFFAGLLVIGFLATLPLFFLAFFRSRGSSWKNSLLVTLGMWAFCLVVFQLALGFDMWPGMIPELLSGIIGGGITPPL
jgi:hypothetical protein